MPKGRAKNSSMRYFSHLFESPMSHSADFPLQESAQLHALSPLDGRYAAQPSALRAWFSEAALIRHRVIVEIHWLIALSRAGFTELPPFPARTETFLRRLAEQFSPHDAARVKAIERATNHDIKAVEYWLKESIQGQAELERAREFIHFACTSEDINNTAYGLMLKARAHMCCCPRWRSCTRNCARLRICMRRNRCWRARMDSRRAQQRWARNSPISRRGWRARLSACARQSGSARWMAPPAIRTRTTAPIPTLTGRHLRARWLNGLDCSLIPIPPRLNRMTRWPNCSTRSRASTRS